MREHLGEEFGGTVSAVTSFGLFVTLDALYVEGLVHITELGGEYYRFDEARQELRGERTGVRYAVGARVRVQVSRVDLDGRKIDFRLVREGEGDATRLRTRRDRTGEKLEGEAGELAKLKATDRAAKAATKASVAARAAVRILRAAKATARKSSAPARGSNVAETVAPGAGARFGARRTSPCVRSGLPRATQAAPRPRPWRHAAVLRTAACQPLSTSSPWRRCDQSPPIQPASTSPA
ncbi:MAG: S1 RNA-binding domain-containing protein [Comamonadaceae bacterium]|nr:S1 RNA-binding domain-containing protein [Comamonadaceae bacterium]